MSLAKRIIPCLDICDGRVVKGVQFINIRDAGDPVAVAQRYAQQGADEIAFLDISATNEGRKTTADMVSKVAKQVFIPLTVGGGINSAADVQAMLNAGADKVSINSAALHQHNLIASLADSFGSQCIVIAIDAKRIRAGKWQVFSHGGRKNMEIDAIAWALEMTKDGAGEVLLTSMDKDGTQDGFDLELTKTVSEAVSVPVIASGGVGCLEHLSAGILEGGADAVLAASIFHFGKYSIMDAKKFLAKKGIVMRLT